MRKTNQLTSLFSQLCIRVKLNNFNENHTYSVESLKLDFNSAYGGYRIDRVHTSTAESFFFYSSRFTRKEMIAFIQGLLIGLDASTDDTIFNK